MAGQNVSLNETRPERFAAAIRDLFAGRSNAVGTVTLRPSQTTTTVEAINCGASSRVFLMPAHADAAVAMATGDLYISSVAGGSFIITHASDVSTDQAFFWVCLG